MGKNNSTVLCIDIGSDTLKAAEFAYSHEGTMDLVNFEFMDFHELFDTIQKDAHRETPLYDIYLYDSSWFHYLQNTRMKPMVYLKSMSQR